MPEGRSHLGGVAAIGGGRGFVRGIHALTVLSGRLRGCDGGRHRPHRGPARPQGESITARAPADPRRVQLEPTHAGWRLPR